MGLPFGLTIHFYFLIFGKTISIPMKKFFLTLIALCLILNAGAQVNMSLSNPEAEHIVFGNYDPVQYEPLQIINNPDTILHGIVNDVSKDTLIAWLSKIDSFYNRNTGSDTVSDTRGIGAVRRWIHSKFVEISADNDNRLIVSYMDFDINICGATHHRNVLGVLPGMDTSNKEIVFIEGHFDTRCEGACDTSCYSPGMDDNGSGTVLVMELARIMSKYAFDQTVIFALPTGEDQGLYGAKAFASYFKNNDIQIRACLNNDVVGGIACGMTSSPPSCPYYNHIDSTNVRIFSNSPGNDSSTVSKHKQLARYMKFQQETDINPLLNTQMNINIIIREDRAGRSGDHIPFRQKGYAAIRVCSQNEHGNGSGTPPDRQHTTTDVLGLDLSFPPDGIIDTFFVDPGYLQRNTIMNGVNAGYLAMAPPIPTPEFIPLPSGIEVHMTGADAQYLHYHLCVRSKGSGSLYFDTVYTFTGTTILYLPELAPEKEFYFSVMNVENGVESLPCDELTHITVGTGQLNWIEDIRMMQNIPNPFQDQTYIPIWSGSQYDRPAKIKITDITGREVHSIPLVLEPGKNQYPLLNDGSLKGMYTYTLIIDNRAVQTRKLIVL